MNAGQERRKKVKKRNEKKRNKFPVLYENIPQSPNTVHYIQKSSYGFFSTASTIYNSNIVDNQPKKQKYDSYINKAEHRYNIGMHAVNKHPVNNILRLNKVFL